MDKQTLEAALTELYSLKRCILAKISKEDDITSLHPIGQGTFGEMLAMMYDRLKVLTLPELGILTKNGQIYPHDYYPKNIAKNDSTSG